MGVDGLLLAYFPFFPSTNLLFGVIDLQGHVCSKVFLSHFYSFVSFEITYSGESRVCKCTWTCANVEFSSTVRASYLVVLIRGNCDASSLPKAYWQVLMFADSSCRGCCGAHATWDTAYTSGKKQKFAWTVVGKTWTLFQTNRWDKNHECGPFERRQKRWTYHGLRAACG